MRNRGAQPLYFLDHRAFVGGLHRGDILWLAIRDAFQPPAEDGPTSRNISSALSILTLPTRCTLDGII